MSVQSYKDLIVWQKAMDLAVEVYALTKQFPPDERFRMVDQITRAATSVPANIAEGHGRAGTKEYSNFLSIAKGSLMETETFLLLAIRLEFISKEESQTALGLVTEVSKMLSSLRRRLLDR